MLSERAEEALETLWIALEEQQEKEVAPDTLGRAVVDELQVAGLVTAADDLVSLTDEGRVEARGVVRRHRLAERLLTDVLGSHERLTHERACRFEHLLDRGLDDNICTLLGHPRVCPHGKPIPPGRCCARHSQQVGAVVRPLRDMMPGQHGKVAYVYAPETGRLQKLMAMGILLGAPVRLLQKFPSLVFEAGHSQFAVDEEIAGAVFVRLGDEEPLPEVPPRRHRRRFRHWFGRHSG